MAVQFTEEILRETIKRLADENKKLRDENARLSSLINTPRTDEFFESVKLEAAHQIERWGVEHDQGKGAPEWFWLLSYLSGKALHFPEKRMHHIVSSAAMLLNWWRAENKLSTEMRPGVATPPGESDG